MSLELKKAQNGSYVIHKYYTRGTELISADILEDGSYVKRLHIMDGHGSVTALAENAQEAGTGGNPESTEEAIIRNSQTPMSMMHMEISLNRQEIQTTTTCIQASSIMRQQGYTT